MGVPGFSSKLTTGKSDSTQSDAFAALVKDLTLHITAAKPLCITREEVAAEIVDKEKEIFREQMKGKPDDIIDRILEGKMNKFYSTNCLLEQGFIKDTDKSISDLLAEVGKEIGDEISIARFERYAIGEA